MTFSQIYFSLDGRIPRSVYWLYGQLVFSVLFTTAILLDMALELPFIITGIVSLLIAWPMFAIMVKRWHDRDKSGWWFFIQLVPLIGQLWFIIEVGFLRGTIGNNKYGPDPVAQ